ncbi:MAG TPA: protein translocase subunit SecD [Vicinamibacteria bacterium]|nr:protein translocase subunit SecD [Vicinamibacteria bacterium]
MPQSLQNPFVLWLVLTAALVGLVYAFLRRELRVKAACYGAFLIACGVACWPPYRTATEPGKIRLGLDLRGGIHFVLQVITDDALVATTDDAVQTAREQVTGKGITFASAQRVSSSTFLVTGVEPARIKDVRDILKDFFRAGWDVRDKGDGFEVAMTDPFVREIKQRTVKEAIRTLERRVNELGVAEPVIAEHGQAGDQILVQLPGLTDVEQAKRMIQRTAQLTLKLVEDVAGGEEALAQARGGKLPDNMEVVQGPGDQPGQPLYYLVRREAVITGRDLKHARAGVDPQTNAPDVQFTLNPIGAEKFKRETGRNVGRRLAIILDGRVETAPTINSQIGADGVIQGRFTAQEADELAKVLRAGALPANLKFLQELSVGASLGKDSIRSGVAATIAGMAFLGIFMIVYYRLSGVNAIVALSANLLILLGAMAYAGATLTLPGIAGIILTVGVGVDTNVLVFERIREELRNGKTVKAAIQNGFERVWITILDTHATALIAAAFLFQFGTGPIKGFAVTLVMGLIANVFASYFVSKFLFEWVLSGRQTAQATLSI